MNKLMCRFEATLKKKRKIASPILDTVCPQGIPHKNLDTRAGGKCETQMVFLEVCMCVWVAMGGGWIFSGT